MSASAREPSLAASWRASLAGPAIRRDGAWIGAWADPDTRLSGLAHVIEAVESSPDRVLKLSRVSRVVAGEIWEQPVIVKRYLAPTGWKRWTNRYRASRARRCWATSATLRGAGIACTQCLGFLEKSRESVAVFAAEPGAVPARGWIKAWLHQRPQEFRAQFRDDLADAFLELYRNQVYHADTKASNMLLLHPEDPAHRAFLWIDLECVRFGVTPTRRQILRNLVQLNGSVGSKLSEPDRLSFLEALAGTFPWLTDPDVAVRIRDWTMERLQRELTGQCGP